MAMRAAEIFVFLIAGIFLDQREGGPDRPGQFHKFDVFFLAFPDVAGKRAEQRTEDQHVAQQTEKYALKVSVLISRTARDANNRKLFSASVP